ncbi:MAG: hypothetical protein ACI9VR_003783 [Cognaticolwellia sp.]|jgi:hypothetical protein
MIWLLLLACRKDVDPKDSDTPVVDTRDPKSHCTLNADGERNSVITTLAGAQVYISADADFEGPQVPVAVIHGGFSGEQVPPVPSTILNPGGGYVQLHTDLIGSDSVEGDMDHYGGESRAGVLRLLQFAKGMSEDDEGCALADRVPTFDSMILVGLSNGGNLVLSTLADTTLERPPVEALLVWETPSAAPIALNEYHRPEMGDCTLAPELRCEMDYRRLSWAGQGYLDRNDNGELDDDEPTWRGLNTSIGLTFSPEMRALLGDDKDLASREDTRAFWERREGAKQVPAIEVAYPSLKTMIIAGKEDHLQELGGSPHVTGLGLAMTRAGFWVRMNPDSAYSGLEQENDGDIPIGFDSDELLLPGTTDIDEVSAGVHELADRLRAGNWTPNLDEQL